MTLSTRDQNFYSALKKEIERARASGGRPSIAALIGLSGGQPHHFQTLIAKMPENELRGLDYDLQKIGIQSKAISNTLTTPRPIATQQPQELKLADALGATIKALITLDDSDKRHILGVVELFFFGQHLRYAKPAVVPDPAPGPVSLDEFEQHHA